MEIVTPFCLHEQWWPKLILYCEFLCCHADTTGALLRAVLEEHSQGLWWQRNLLPANCPPHFRGRVHLKTVLLVISIGKEISIQSFKGIQYQHPALAVSNFALFSNSYLFILICCIFLSFSCEFSGGGSALLRLCAVHWSQDFSWCIIQLVL